MVLLLLLLLPLLLLLLLLYHYYSILPRGVTVLFTSNRPAEALH